MAINLVRHERNVRARDRNMKKTHRLRLACLMLTTGFMDQQSWIRLLYNLFVSAWFRTLQNSTNDQHTKDYDIYYFFQIKIWKFNIITVFIYFLLFSFFSVKRCTCSSRMKYMMGPFLRQVQNGAYFIYQWSIFVNSLRGTKWGSCWSIFQFCV
jgi:hypothetical protein